MIINAANTCFEPTARGRELGGCPDETSEIMRRYHDDQRGSSHEGSPEAGFAFRGCRRRPTRFSAANRSSGMGAGRAARFSRRLLSAFRARPPGLLRGDVDWQDVDWAGLDSEGWLGELAGQAVDRRAMALLACTGVVVPRDRGPPSSRYRPHRGPSSSPPKAGRFLTHGAAWIKRSAANSYSSTKCRFAFRGARPDTGPSGGVRGHWEIQTEFD